MRFISERGLFLKEVKSYASSVSTSHTLKYLINVEPIINVEGGEKIHPPRFLLHKFINEEGGIFCLLR